MTTHKLSIIVPVFNEGHAVWTAFDAIANVCRSRLAGWDFEVVFVDDGSQDDSPRQLEQLCEKHANATAILLATNCGSQRAIRAGLEYADGDVACFIPCDLQESPEIIPAMLEALVKPIEVVFAVRKNRNDPWISRLMSRLFFLLARLLISRNIPAKGIGTFLLGSSAIKVLRRYKERNLTLGGLLMNLGFPYACVPYERGSRHSGDSKWTAAKRLELFVNYFVAYSYIPIRIMSWLGIFVAMLGFIWGIVVIANWFFFSHTLPSGWTSLMAALLFLGGIQMMMTGVIGEYLWRTLDEVRGRPTYVISRVLNERKSISDNGSTVCHV